MASRRDFERSTVTISGAEIELYEGGEGAPLLVLHGGNGITPQDAFISSLTAHRRVLLPSHLGFGGSALPDWADSVDDVAHVYLALLDRLGLSKLDVLGWSLGGWIAAEMATKSLDLIRRLVLISPVGIKIGPVDRLDIPDVFALPPAKLESLLFHDPQAHRVDPRSLTDEQAAVKARNRETLALMSWEPYMHNPKLKHRLANCKCETLFIRGESDGLVSAEYFAGYAALIPGASAITLPKAGHVPYLEQPEALLAAVRAFLDRP